LPVLHALPPPSKDEEMDDPAHLAATSPASSAIPLVSDALEGGSDVCEGAEEQSNWRRGVSGSSAEPVLPRLAAVTGKPVAVAAVAAPAVDVSSSSPVDETPDEGGGTIFGPRAGDVPSDSPPPPVVAATTAPPPPWGGGPPPRDRMRRSVDLISAGPAAIMRPMAPIPIGLLSRAAAAARRPPPAAMRAAAGGADEVDLVAPAPPFPPPTRTPVRAPPPPAPRLRARVARESIAPVRTALVPVLVPPPRSGHSPTLAPTGLEDSLSPASSSASDPVPPPLSGSRGVWTEGMSGVGKGRA